MGTANKIQDLLRRTRGIDAVFLLEEEDRVKLLDVEIAAEKKAFMGLGMCYNSGIRDVLRCPLVFVCITNMNFEWGCEAHMVLKKDDIIVGEEVLEDSRIEQLKDRKDVWFLHKNFVIYKERVAFPQDLVEKKCCFEIPALTFDRAIDWKCTTAGIPSLPPRETYSSKADSMGHRTRRVLELPCSASIFGS